MSNLLGGKGTIPEYIEAGTGASLWANTSALVINFNYSNNGYFRFMFPKSTDIKQFAYRLNDGTDYGWHIVSAAT